MPFIPHTDSDVKEMLAAIGAPTVEALFDEIPQNLRCGKLTRIPDGLSEMETSRLLRGARAQDRLALNFIGAGAYEHHNPPAVWEITTRGEFYSAYTPYQAEASQGTLQLLYEFQTMMTELTGMDVSNASLYDGASALAEALLMSARANAKNDSLTMLMPKALHPYYADVAMSITHAQGLRQAVIAYEPKSGQTALDALKSYEGVAPTAVVIAQPNFFGVLEDVDTITDWAHAQGALVIALVNPTSLALLKPPSQWGARGADIVCGEGQPLGVPLASGGPYFGFLTCKKEFVRQMPGRIIGRTVDLDGKPGYTLTLQAREQHIRRAKATSNICTNQGLLVTAATIYMSLVGAEGLAKVASGSMTSTQGLVEALTGIPGVSRVFSGAIFHEAVLKLPRPVAEVLEKLADEGILGGWDLSRHYPELGQCLLVCATETKTSADIQRYAQSLRRALA
jgi:glycine dehydrogenase subunit 1